MNTEQRNKTAIRAMLRMVAMIVCLWLIPAFAQTSYSISPNPASVNENAGSVTFTITRSGQTPAETIYASTTQTEGYSNSGDYTGVANQAVSFASGQTSSTVTVTILNDSTVENNETFGFIVQRHTYDAVSTYLAKSTFTIVDDDTLATTYSISPNPASVNESAGSVTFTITRSGGLPAETVYASTTQSEGYVNSGDYTGVANQAVGFASGQTSSTVAVTILNDSTAENNETFGFIVQRHTYDPVTTYLAKSTFTIVDDDIQATTYSISPNPVSVNEYAGSVTFTITRSGGTPAETIYASTTQSEGYVNSGDYAGVANQAVSFASGQTSSTVAVTILNDSTAENNETFGFIVQRHTYDPLTTYLAKSTFTIVDDDTIDPPVSDGFDYPIGSRIRYTEANDGDGWYVATEFNELSNSKYHLGEDWNAESGGNTDYGSPVYAVANGTIVFAGPATVSGWGNVLIIRHKLADGTLVESLYGHVATFLKMSGNVVRGEQVATIGDGGGLYAAHLHLEIRFSNCPNWGNEGLGYSLTPSPQGWTDPSDFLDAHRPAGSTTYSISPNPATVNESAGSVTFTITRSGATPAETIYASTTQSEGYLNNGDYTGVANQPVSFAAGQTSSSVTVTILNDSITEDNETFGFIVQRHTYDPVTTYLAKSTFTIVDDDGGAAEYPGATWNPAASANITVANRTSSDVRWIIIHTTEGTTASAIQRFQDPAQQASAHYIVSRDGSIFQLVRNEDISFGAGNYSYNEKCINIEHERYDGYDVTPAEYAASAALVKWLAARYNVQIIFPGVPNGIAPADPMNGTGIIGHRQVPDPTNPALGGGLNHHTDPVNWDWSYYESLFSEPATPNITSPLPGSILGSNSATFQWTAGTGVSAYFLYVGTAFGTNNLYGQNQGQNLSVTVSNLPVDGSTLYVRLWWQVGGLWSYFDYTYTAKGAQLPTNDAFANRIMINSSAATLTGTDINATKENGEPDHDGNGGGKSVWWSWTAPANGTVTVDTIGSSFDTVLAIYTGTSVNSLTAVAADDDSGGNLTSKSSFIATAGTVYQIAVDGYAGASGNIQVHVAFVASGPALTGIGGGPLLPPSNGQFSFEVHSDQAQVTIQASDDLRTWTDVGTVVLANGKAVFTDTNAAAHPRRYYRPKP